MSKYLHTIRIEYTNNFGYQYEDIGFKTTSYDREEALILFKQWFKDTRPHWFKLIKASVIICRQTYS